MTPAAARYSRGETCSFADVSFPVLKNLVHGKVIRKHAKGTGHYHLFTLDDVVKVAIAKALLNLGVQVASIRSLFAAIETPQFAEGHPWAWLQAPDRRTEGAMLCLITAHPSLPPAAGAVCLTTRAGARRIIAGQGKAILIDVHDLITTIETRAGVRYGA